MYFLLQEIVLSPTSTGEPQIFEKTVQFWKFFMWEKKKKLIFAIILGKSLEMDQYSWLSKIICLQKMKLETFDILVILNRRSVTDHKPDNFEECGTGWCVLTFG